MNDCSEVQERNADFRKLTTSYWSKSATSMVLFFPSTPNEITDNRKRASIGHLLSTMFHTIYASDVCEVTMLKAKFHYAIWSQTGSKLVAHLLVRAR